jgi:hypothetical protein
MTRKILSMGAALLVLPVAAPGELILHVPFDDQDVSDGSEIAVAVGEPGRVVGEGARSVEGRQGRAIEFGGKACVDLSANAPALAGLETGSIAFWFRQLPDSGFGAWISGSNAAGQSSEIRVQTVNENGSISYQGRADGEFFFEELSDSGRHNDGEWHHVVATSTGSDIELYINGQLQSREKIPGTGFFAAIPGLDSLTVGGNRHVYGMQWQVTGAIDDVRVYDHVLSQREISALTD